MRLKFLLLAIAAVLAIRDAIAEETNEVEDLLAGAQAASVGGKLDEAVALTTRAIAAEPSNPRGYLLRARLLEASRQPAKAVADYDAVLKLNPMLTEPWQRRGEIQFKLGHIKESIADFDKYLELVPQQKPHHWQRGISLYHASRYADGRRQFELHQTVNSNDVENAVWHFLCVTRESGLTNARAALIPIQGDARVPMKEVHALFAGKAQPGDVLKAANNNGNPAQRKQQLFYAHLYLGLYFEATGELKLSDEHIKRAAVDYRMDDYMGEVARVHLLLRDKEKASPK